MIFIFNPYPTNVEYVELLIMLENGRWDLTGHLKGQNLLIHSAVSFSIFDYSY